MSDARIVPRGVIAGVVGATVMAAWFLAVDWLQGTPLQTPAFVAGALLGGSGAVAAGPVIIYSLIHYAAFVLVGIGISAMLSRIRISAPSLLGAVVGFLLFDAVFYGSVVVTGVDVVAALGWPAVLVGNLLAGLALMAVLHWSGATSPEPTLFRRLSRRPVIREGVMVGLVGAVVVALWFLVLDGAQGQLFRTPATLGSALFLGAESPAEVQYGFGVIAGYTLVHGALWIIAGLVVAALASAAERTPPILLAAGLLFVSFEAFFMGIVAVAAQVFLGPDAWWAIGAGNILAALVMGRMLWAGHPRLAQELRNKEFLTAS